VSKNRSIVELITPHRTTNHHETRKGDQGPVWAVVPMKFLEKFIIASRTKKMHEIQIEFPGKKLSYSLQLPSALLTVPVVHNKEVKCFGI
jgi:hypothetical protein